MQLRIQMGRIRLGRLHQSFTSQRVRKKFNRQKPGIWPRFMHHSYQLAAPAVTIMRRSWQNLMWNAPKFNCKRPHRFNPTDNGLQPSGISRKRFLSNAEFPTQLMKYFLRPTSWDTSMSKCKRFPSQVHEPGTKHSNSSS